MEALLIPALLLGAVLLIGFLAWELYFTKRGRQAIVEQHHAEGNDEPPKTI
jgi:hypothetical protein